MAYLFTDDKNCIITGLRADIMRSSMENKNLLESQGSIYVGTGSKNTLTDGTQVMKTKELKIGTVGQVLMSSGSDLVYGSLLNDSFDSNIQYANLKLIDGANRDNGSSVDGLTLTQSTSTGYLSLSGCISKLYSANGSTVLMQADVDANGNNIVTANNLIKMAASTDTLFYYNRSSIGSIGSGNPGVYIGKDGISVLPSTTGYGVLLNSNGISSQKIYASNTCLVGSKYPVLFGSATDSTHRILVCGTVSSVAGGKWGYVQLRSSSRNTYGIISIDFAVATSKGTSESQSLSGVTSPCKTYCYNNGEDLRVYVGNDGDDSSTSDFTFFAICTRDY